MKKWLNYVILFVGYMLVSCDFKDPLVDAHGAKINLVRMDLPKFDARYMIRMVDSNGRPIPSATVELAFVGTDANLLITDAGRIVMKENTPTYEDYRTAKYGMLGLNLNPNFKVASHPIEFQINGADVALREYIVIPKIVRQTVAGDLSVDVMAVRFSSSPRVGLAAEAFEADQLSVDGGNVEKIASLNGQNGNGYNVIALYRSTESSQRVFRCQNNGRELVDYGIYLLGEEMSTAPTKSKAIDAASYFLLVAKPEKMIEGKIKINVNSDITGVAASFPYTITTIDGVAVGSGSVSGILPFSATIEQVFVCERTPQVKIALGGTNTVSVVSDQPQTAVICESESPEINFSTTTRKGATTDLRRCDISVIGVCSTNKQIAFCPTIRFQYTLKDADRWEWAESKGGKIVLMLDPNRDYTVRIPINNVWQEFGITTNRDRIFAIVRDQPSVSKFELINNADGSMNIKVEYRDQEFCNMSL